MVGGIFAGVMWAAETVVIGIALGMPPFNLGGQAMLLAPFIATFLHDALSAIFMFIYNAVRGNIKKMFSVCHTKSFKWLVLASVVGGPVGMTGYVLAVNYMGSSVGAVASAVYPAIGTFLAYIFLKERVRWYQWIFLGATLVGVYALSYSPTLNIESFWLGLIGALMCALGWGVEAVILAKCLKDDSIKNETALNVRQTVSALTYGVIILPLIGGWKITAGIFVTGTGMLLPTIAMAALCATVSYLFYYRTIARIGAAKAMALNITYTAWAMLFAVVLLHDFSVINPTTLISSAVVVVFGILAATDFKVLFAKRNIDINDL